MVAPITRGPKILGLLAVADRTGRAPFTDEDLNLLLALAGQATIAVENLRLHDEIKKANTLLQEYDRLKSEFVGIVAHDFRRPLMAIRGFAELVLEEPDLAARDAARVHAHGDQRDRPPRAPRQRHAAHHPDRDRPDQLHLPRGGPGALPARGGAARPLRPLGADGRARRASRRSGPTPTGCARCSTNLVSNAVKYSPAGGSIMVRVRERGRAARGDRGGRPRARDPARAGRQALPEVRPGAHRGAPQGLGDRASGSTSAGSSSRATAGRSGWSRSWARAAPSGCRCPIDARLAQRPLDPGEKEAPLPRRAARRQLSAAPRSRLSGASGAARPRRAAARSSPAGCGAARGGGGSP